MIEVRDLHKAFGTVKAVDGVSFTARDGEITGLLGPNGAGKTTTLRMLYTLMTPDRGQVLVDGGAVAFNVHDGSKLYASTVRTLADVFPTLDLYATGLGEVIAVATASPAPDKEILERRAAALQERYGFRFPLPAMLQRRLDKHPPQAAGADLITDDFAPVEKIGLAHLVKTFAPIKRCESRTAVGVQAL